LPFSSCSLTHQLSDFDIGLISSGSAQLCTTGNLGLPIPRTKASYAKGRALFELGREEETIAFLKIDTGKQPEWEGSLLSHQVLGQIYRLRRENELAEFHKFQGTGPILFKE
jgi:hypothetical protein